MNTPFFSIVIPTRGRPELLRDALASALFQDFDDFEVVISDNCNDDRTQKVLDEFHSHDRLRCIRPERLLPMPDHWEFASKQANGTYVLLLTDRSVLKRHALRTIHDAISTASGDVAVCSWRWSLYDDLAMQEISDSPIFAGDGAMMLTSRLIATDFIKGSHQNAYSLPRGLNSCYRNDLARSLRSQFGTLFSSICPDFTSAFMLLANINDVLFVDKALFVSQGLGLSNGGDAFSRTAATYLDSLGDGDWFSRVPIKAPLVWNAVYQDYLTIRDLAGGNLNQLNVDWIVYFETCYRELIKKTKTGLISPGELDGLFAEWSRALDESDVPVQEEMRRKLKKLSRIRQRAQLKASAIGKFVRGLKRTINKFRRRWRRAKGGQTALEAAGFRGDE